MDKGMSSLGGIARAGSLTPEKRREIAKKAAEKRWGKQVQLPLTGLTAVAGNEKTLIRFGDIEVPCYVLDNGMRVFSGKSMQDALGFAKNDSGVALKRFVLSEKVKGLFPDEVLGKFDRRIEFKRAGSGGAVDVTYGYEATLLIDLCDLVLQGKNDGTIKTESQLKIARQAEIIVRSVAKVGIVALVDEVTGYQKQKDEYQRILSDYIDKELRPWLMTFDENYYKQLYRLLGWSWDAFRGSKRNHPSYIGKLTNRIVYEKLPPGVLEALKVVNPKNEHGNRSNRFHQHLTENIGYRHLIKHIAAVTAIMEMYPNCGWTEALQRIDTRYPSMRLPFQTSIPLE